ncbi:hypothetical protein QUQ16_000182 [Escherichia coli]|nr:hypothetical protein [Escherichia coli]
MAKQKAKLSHEELLDILQKNFNYAWQDKENYSQRYGNAWRYYRGMEPRDTNNTGVEPVQIIREIVEENFQVFKTFFNDSTSSVVNVHSNNLKSSVADAISKALNTAAMNLNQISRKYEGWMKETLLTGNGHMKIYLQEKILDERTDKFENKPEEYVAALEKHYNSRGFNDVTIKITNEVSKRSTKTERDEGAKYGLTVPKTYKLYDGTVTAIARETKPAIDYIPFEQIYISPLTQFSLDDAPYMCHTYYLPISDGLRMGWDLEIMQEGDSYFETDPNFSTTGLIVGQQYNPFNVDGAGITPTAESDYFQVYEHYWRGVYRGKYAKIWKIYATKTALLAEPEEVDEIPFVSARVMEIPNSFYGEGIYDSARVIQDSKTRELRMLTYTAQNNAYGRYWGVKDSYDKDSLLDNRAGGVIEVDSPQAIGLFPVADISQAMKLLIDDTNERIQAQLKSAGSLTDDAAKMAETSGIAVSMLINKSEQGIKSRASTFAETGLLPLYHKLYRLLQKIEHPVDGLQAGFTMADFPKDIGLTFDVSTLTDKQQDAQNILTAYQMIQQLNGGQLPQWINSENQYNALSQYVKAGTGNNDISSYITDPKTIKPSKAQQYMQAVQYQSQIEQLKGAGELAILENQKTLSEARKNDAQAALYASQMKASVSDDERKNELQLLNVNNMILQNAKLAADIESEKQANALEPIKLEAEISEIQSGIVAEQANILNAQYATGANVNVN